MRPRNTRDTLAKVDKEIIACRACPRLVAWREQVAREKTKRFAHETYCGKPIPGFGDPQARLLIVGLAPAAHGGNRTGRVFTGDRSGDWLFRALHKAGFANQAESIRRGDGLALKDCRILAAVRCAPPDNKPLPEEFAACRCFLLRETALVRARVVVGLGKLAFDQAYSALREIHVPDAKRREARPRFGHGASAELPWGQTLLGSFHPSQQNTFTGRLTEKMLDDVFAAARRILARRGVD